MYVKRSKTTFGEFEINVSSFSDIPGSIPAFLSLLMTNSCSSSNLVLLED